MAYIQVFEGGDIVAGARTTHCLNLTMVHEQAHRIGKGHDWEWKECERTLLKQCLPLFNRDKFK